MTIRNGAGELMLADFFLYWPETNFEMVVDSLSPCLGRVAASCRLKPRVKPTWGVTAFSSKSQLITDPRIHGEYETAYQAAAPVASRQPLAELHAVLRRFTPLAKSELEWGAIDALADEPSKRNEQKSFL